jgi:ParB family chromosome partitioning protein
MSTKRRGLGRGLDALLSGSAPTVANDQSSVSTQLTELAVERLCRGRYQPRRDMEPQALEELAASIKVQGIMQPIVVRPIGGDNFEIIAGERRWRAAQMAGLERVPVVIRDVPDEAAIAMALIENIQRENLNPIEEAIALQRLQQEFELSQQEVADAVGKSRTAVTNLLRLINLTDEVKRMLEHGDLEMGHARALLPLSEELQIDAGREVVVKGLSVRQTELLVRTLQNPAEPKAKPELTSTHERIVDDLTRLLSTKVTLSENAKGQGKIVISYNDAKELKAIVKQLRD